MSIKFEQPGITNVQDGGRYGWQQYGVNVSGPMDMDAFHAANILLDNDRNTGALEVQMLGPAIRFQEDNIFAVTGGDFGPKLNNIPIPGYQAVCAKAGDMLSFTGMKTGLRAYIAFAGGLDIPEVMNSQSTNIKGGFGGFKGRMIKTGDVISFKAPKKILPFMNARRFEPPAMPGNEIELRVVQGPEDGDFTEAGLKTFYSSEYKMTDQTDRLGSKLEGPVIEHVKDGNIISNGIICGSIQVPSYGQPVIMLRDCLPTGGYTKIATVISSDISLIAQCRVGCMIRFKKVTVQEAQKIYLEKMKTENAMADRIRKGILFGQPKEIKVTVNGVDYIVTVEQAVV